MDTHIAMNVTPAGYVQGDAGRLYVDDGASGDIPVLFTHSFGGSTRHWEYQLEHLRNTTRAIAFDFRGHGRSDAPADKDYSAEALADDIAAVADALKLKRFVLVGHSMGGAAAAAYAAKYPERLAGLVLVGTPGKSSEEMSKQVIGSLQSNQYDKVMEGYMQKLLANATPQTNDLVLADAAHLDKETNIAIIKSIFAFDPLPGISAFTGPRLIVHTEGDNQPGALHMQLKDIPAKQVGGTSHWMMLDRPDEFNTILDDFLAKLE